MAPVLLAVGDLLFRSKIRAVAKQLGIETATATTREEILASARATRPPLVIFDLDDPRSDPVATIGALKSDPALEGVRTVGFLSHVHVELMEAAQAAGCDEVLPRSAFAQRLGDILQGALA